MGAGGDGGGCPVKGVVWGHFCRVAVGGGEGGKEGDDVRLDFNKSWDMRAVSILRLNWRFDRDKAL